MRMLARPDQSRLPALRFQRDCQKFHYHTHTTAPVATLGERAAGRRLKVVRAVQSMPEVELPAVPGLNVCTFPRVASADGVPSYAGIMLQEGFQHVQLWPESIVYTPPLLASSPPPFPNPASEQLSRTSRNFAAAAGGKSSGRNSKKGGAAAFKKNISYFQLP